MSVEKFTGKATYRGYYLEYTLNDRTEDCVGPFPSTADAQSYLYENPSMNWYYVTSEPLTKPRKP